MDSYYYKDFLWVACHECQLRGNESLCSIGRCVTDAKSNYFSYGCYNGVIEKELENEVQKQKDRG